MISMLYLPAGINGVLSLAIIFVCICRADKITGSVLNRVKAQYVLMVMGAGVNGAAPWFHELPGWTSVAFSLVVLFMLVADSYQWRRGPPPSATGPAPLGDL